MEGHTKIAEVRVNKVAANLLGALVALGLCAAGFLLARSLPHHVRSAPWHDSAVLIAIIILVPFHEGLHALGWRWFGGASWSDIKFGVMWQVLTPYCHCRAPLPVSAYMKGGLLPFWVTGSLSLAAVLLYPADLVGVFAGFTIAACFGDFWVAIKLKKFDRTYLVLDSPTQIGFDVYAPAQCETANAS